MQIEKFSLFNIVKEQQKNLCFLVPLKSPVSDNNGKKQVCQRQSFLITFSILSSFKSSEVIADESHDVKKPVWLM